MFQNLSPMKNFLSLLSIVFLPICLLAQSDKATLLNHVWYNGKKEVKVKFCEKEGKYYGDVIWLVETLGNHIEPLKDLKNPNAELRSREILDMPLIEEMEYKNGEWKGGTAYNPRSGRYFKCRMWLESEDVLKVRGYWGFLYDTETWTKASD